MMHRTSVPTPVHGILALLGHALNLGTANIFRWAKSGCRLAGTMLRATPGPRAERSVVEGLMGEKPESLTDTRGGLGVQDLID